jgi:hypothetical protein
MGRTLGEVAETWQDYSTLRFHKGQPMHGCKIIKREGDSGVDRAIVIPDTPWRHVPSRPLQEVADIRPTWSAHCLLVGCALRGVTSFGRSFHQPLCHFDICAGHVRAPALKHCIWQVLTPVSKHHSLTAVFGLAVDPGWISVCCQLCDHSATSDLSGFSRCPLPSALQCLRV